MLKNFIILINNKFAPTWAFLWTFFDSSYFARFKLWNWSFIFIGSAEDNRMLRVTCSSTYKNQLWRFWDIVCGISEHILWISEYRNWLINFCTLYALFSYIRNYDIIKSYKTRKIINTKEAYALQFTGSWPDGFPIVTFTKLIPLFWSTLCWLSILRANFTHIST